MHKKPIPISLALTSGAFIVALTVVAGTLFSAKAQQVQQPVVVELFTSQGCSSCPPADKLLTELSGRDDIIALSLPIDYWDNLGWPDTFAAPEHTQRQRHYASLLPNSRVYTPQMVVNGHIDVVGSRRGDVLAAIDSEMQRSHVGISITLASRDEALEISLERAPEELRDIEASVWIVPFHAGVQKVEVRSGENGGKSLHYSNVVQGLMKLGMYHGEPTTFTHSLAMMKHKNVNDCVVLIQNDTSGEIIGVRELNLAALD